MRAKPGPSTPSNPFWHRDVQQQVAQLDSSEHGLSHQGAALRLSRDGTNRLQGKKPTRAWRLLLVQFKNSIILLLLFATGISFCLHDRTDALTSVLVGGCLGFWQEKGAADTVAKLLAMVEIEVAVLRDGELQDILADDLVAGDVVSLKAGVIVPADCLLISADNLFVDKPR